MSSIPILRNENGWLTDAKKKADIFARTFSDKAKLPAEVVDTPLLILQRISSMKLLSLDPVPVRNC